MINNMTKFGNRDRHSALRTEQVSAVSAQGIQFMKIRLQWGKDDYGFSLHAVPSSYSSYGIQTTDFLTYLGFERGPCAFASSRECFSRWIIDNFDLDRFAEAFGISFRQLEKAERALENCGYLLSKPEGWGYFFGKSGTDSRRGYGSYLSTDGHTSPKSEIMKNVEDEYFRFILSWIEGGSNQGWTFHYRPKHLPLSPEFDIVIRYLGLNTFEECPCFDFDSCHWKFIPFERRGDSLFNSNAEIVHKWFDAHPQNFSEGIRWLLSSQTLLDPFEMTFLPVEQKESVRIEAHLERNIKRSDKPSKYKTGTYDFDVAISFAGTERQPAERLATFVSDAGFDVFYDDFYPEQLWGRDLITFFDQVYRKRSRYCVIFVSSAYCERMWTNHERSSAQARGLEEKGNGHP